MREFSGELQKNIRNKSISVPLALSQMPVTFTERAAMGRGHRMLMDCIMWNIGTHSI